MTNMHKWSLIKKGSAKTGLFCSDKLVKSPKHFFVVTAAIFVFLAIFFSTAVHRGADPETLKSTTSTAGLVASAVSETILQQSTEAVPPIRIKIPTIRLDAAIEPVGVTARGEMGIPTNPDNVAWYDLGQAPGEIGTAVIAGHNIWKNGNASTFTNLSALNLGDKIYIENEKGQTAVFAVKKTRKYSPQIDTTDIFRSSDGKAHLNLITCAGSWDKSTESFTQRLIVFAEKE